MDAFYYKDTVKTPLLGSFVDLGWLKMPSWIWRTGNWWTKCQGMKLTDTKLKDKTDIV